MGAPKIPPTVKTCIIKTSNKMWNTTGKEPIAEAVMIEAKHILDLEGKKHLPFPELRTVQDILKKYKDTQRELGPREFQIDAPWSLGAMKTMKEYELSADAIPTVLHVMRHCLAIGETLTIRQAMWVAHLSALTNNANELWRIASVYADREFTCQLEGNLPFDTSDLDAAASMNEWSLHTAHWASNVKRITASWEYVPSPSELKYSSPDSYTAALVAENYLRFEFQQWNRFEELRDKWDDIPQLDRARELTFEPDDPDHVSFRTEEAYWVYAHWLTCIRKDRKLRDLLLDQVIDIIHKLREWVRGHPEDQRVGVIPHYQRWVLTDSPIMPIEILEQVGYDPYSFKGGYPDRTEV